MSLLNVTIQTSGSLVLVMVTPALIQFEMGFEFLIACLFSSMAGNDIQRGVLLSETPCWCDRRALRSGLSAGSADRRA